MNTVFITDLDHTFLRSDLSISPYSERVWNAKAAHNTLTIATARSFKKSEQFVKNLHVNAPMILLDGSLIVSESRQIIERRCIDKELGDAVIDLGATLNSFPFVLALQDTDLNEAFLYPTQRNVYQHRLLQRYRDDDNLQEAAHIRAMKENFKLVYMGEEAMLQELYSRFREMFGDALKYILAPEAYMGCYFLTLLHPHADKAHGLECVSEYLGCHRSEMTVFGDNLNDLGMFEYAGTAVAVKNAHDLLKARADIVLEYSNDEDGVARYLEALRG